MKQKLTNEEKAEIKQEKKSWTDFIRRMKKKGALLSASMFLVFFFIGCSKPTAQELMPQQAQYGEYDFKVTVKLSPVSTTLYYDVFVFSNNEYARQVAKIYPSQIVKGTYSFVFHLEPVMCNGICTIDTRLKLSGHIQEWRPNNNMWTVPDNAITITKCISSPKSN